MPDYLIAAVIVIAAYACIVAALIVVKRRERRGRDDLMAVADTLTGSIWDDSPPTPTWHEHEIEQLRALFHADQTPQPERRRTKS